MDYGAAVSRSFKSEVSRLSGAGQTRFFVMTNTSPKLGLPYYVCALCLMENAMTDEPLMRLMKKYDIPLTRENYLRLAYMGEVPEQLSAEQEADLPVELQL